MAKNSNLHKAKSAKQDEFYTQLTDIEKEMVYYKDYFRGKTIYCNCDDARESNFFKYFSLNFEHLGLKKLITTGYKAEGKGVVLIYEGDKNGNRRVDDCEIEVKELQGNGDFRSSECIEYLKEADIVITNPPFSLFREYLKQLMDYGKKFIIMGNGNAITNKEMFPYIRNGQVWLGRTLFTGKMPFFKMPDNYPIENERFIRKADGIYKQVNSICWYTNVPNDSNREILDLYKSYNENDYPTYDNYNAIECGRMEYLPMNYNGVIGVPITGLKYLWSDGTIHTEINGESVRFEILWQASGNSYANAPKEILEELNFNPEIKYGGGLGTCVLNGKATYSRILIRRK